MSNTIQTQTEVKHTPGPWFTNGTALERSLPIVVAHIPPGHHVSQEQREANYRLIAAAPALLEACEHMIEAFQNSNGVPVSLNGAYFKMRGAITKATCA